MNERPHAHLTFHDMDDVFHRLTRTGSRTMCDRMISSEPWMNRWAQNTLNGEMIAHAAITCLRCIANTWFIEAGYRETYHGTWTPPP